MRSNAWKKIKALLTNFYVDAGNMNIGAYAGSIAFFIFLSIVPILMMFFTILPYTPLTEADLLGFIEHFAPEGYKHAIDVVVDFVYRKSAGTLTFAIITTVWSGGKGAMAMMQGLNAVNEIHPRRNYILVRLLASLYTLILLIVVIASMVIMVFGNNVMNLLFGSFPELKNLYNFLTYFRFPAAWVLMSVLFAFLFTVIPEKKLRFREQIPGAMMASVALTVFSFAFSKYVDYTTSFSVYGSIAIIVIAMLWMYTCMYILLFCAYLNHYFRPVNKALLYRRRDKDE